MKPFNFYGIEENLRTGINHVLYFSAHTAADVIACILIQLFGGMKVKIISSKSEIFFSEEIAKTNINW